MNKKYKQYLQGTHWRAFRQIVLTFWGGRCAICNSAVNVEVHHRHYNSLGDERITDCIALCNFCHKLFSNFTGHFLAGVWAVVAHGQ